MQTKSQLGALKFLAGAGVAVVALATIVITGVAILGGYKDTGLIDNDTADKFIAGLVVFGTFIGIIVLAIVGKVIIGMFK
jgi:hypothetical protein